MSTPLHQACLLLGANIDPAGNLKQAARLLRHHSPLEAVSTVWETAAVGSGGPNFLNAAVLLVTPMLAPELKSQVLRPIEAALGRVRTVDKNASRTIDLDAIIFDGLVLDEGVWNRLHVALPAAEILPDLVNSQGITLRQVAARLLEAGWALAHPEIQL